MTAASAVRPEGRDACFEHDADIGVIGCGKTLEEAFEHGPALCRFWIERDGVRWRGGAMGKPWHARLERGVEVRVVPEEAPGAYKDADLVAEATERAGLARRVALLRPKVRIKG